MHTKACRSGRLSWLALSAGIVGLWTHNTVSAQTIEAGPFFNPANGSRYYVIFGDNYNQLRDFALSMGGDLATVNDADENAFLAANVVSDRKPYIGLNDAATEGTFVWADGSSSTFRNWRVGEPANSAAKDYVQFLSAGEGWQVVEVAFGRTAIVELDASLPVRVPQEVPTLGVALAALPNSGTGKILLAPGTYDLTSALSVMSATVSGSGRGVTVLRSPTTATPGLDLVGAAVISDLTFVNRSTAPSLRFQAGFNRVRNVEFTSLPGAAADEHVEMNTTSSVGSIENCTFHTTEYALDLNAGSLFVTNTVIRDVGAITRFSTTSTLRMSNCTFTRVGAGAMFDTDVTTSIFNSIFHDNTGTIPSQVSLQYCLLPTAQAGAGNQVGNPLFANAAANDFSILPGSPAIDTGYLAEYMSTQPQDLRDIAGNPRAVDDPSSSDKLPGLTPIDLGAFEYQPPATSDTCKPDFNDDGFVDDTDFVTFAQFYDNFFCP